MLNIGAVTEWYNVYTKDVWPRAVSSHARYGDSSAHRVAGPRAVSSRARYDGSSAHQVAGPRAVSSHARYGGSSAHHVAEPEGFTRCSQLIHVHLRGMHWPLARRTTGRVHLPSTIAVERSASESSPSGPGECWRWTAVGPLTRTRSPRSTAAPPAANTPFPSLPVRGQRRTRACSWSLWPLAEHEG